MSYTRGSATNVIKDLRAANKHLVSEVVILRKKLQLLEDAKLRIGTILLRTDACDKELQIMQIGNTPSGLQIVVR